MTDCVRATKPRSFGRLCRQLHYLLAFHCVPSTHPTVGVSRKDSLAIGRKGKRQNDCLMPADKRRHLLTRACVPYFGVAKLRRNAAGGEASAVGRENRIGPWHTVEQLSG